MSSTQTLDLIAAAQKGEGAALERLLKENAPLIWSIVRRFFGRGVESDDLYQLGCIGFIKAVQGFSGDFGTQFSTYAVPKIAGEIKRFLRDDGMVKVSRSLKENAVKVWAAREAYEKRTGGEASLSDISAATGLSVEEIALCLDAAADVSSLDTPIKDDGQSLMDGLGSAANEPEKIIEHMALQDAVKSLEHPKKTIIILRYFKDLTQAKTAKVLGISQVQVSRFERKAIEEIREYLSR